MAGKQGKKKEGKKAVCYFCMFSPNADLYGCCCHLCKSDHESGSTEPGPALFSKLSDSECLTLLFQEVANPHDHKEKVMKTRGRRENIEALNAVAQKLAKKASN